MVAGVSIRLDWNIWCSRPVILSWFSRAIGLSPEGLGGFNLFSASGSCCLVLELLWLMWSGWPLHVDADPTSLYKSRPVEQSFKVYSVVMYSLFIIVLAILSSIANGNPMRIPETLSTRKASCSSTLISCQSTIPTSQYCCAETPQVSGLLSPSRPSLTTRAGLDHHAAVLGYESNHWALK